MFFLILGSVILIYLLFRVKQKYNKAEDQWEKDLWNETRISIIGDMIVLILVVAGVLILNYLSD